MSWFGQQQQQQAAPGFGQAAPGFGAPPAAAAGFAPQQSFGFGQQQPAAPGGFAAFGQQQAAQPAVGFGQPAAVPGFGQASAAQQQPASGFAAFGQAQQPGGGFATFGQQQQQPAAAAPGFSFGQQQQQQPAAAAPGFSFGQQAAPVPPASFTFGQQPQQAPAAGGFAFGQQAAPAPPASFTFGNQSLQQQAAAQQPQAAPQQGFGTPVPGGVKFSFGSAQKKQPAAPAFGMAGGGEDDEGEEMDEAALAAAKAAALASLPTFLGSGGGGGRGAGKPAVAAPPPPPKAALRRSKPSAAAGLDAEEEAKRAQRASRFAPPSAAAAAPAPVAAPPPPPPPRRAPVAAAPAFIGGPAGGYGGGGSGDDFGEGDDDEGGGGMRAGNITGTCEDMCPAPERERRARLADIQIFERPDPNNSSLTSADLAVKRFARTIDESNNAPEYFRTRGALERTMTHLRNLLDRQDARLGLIHKFLWDRYRSVRQDLFVQGMEDEFAIGIFEEVVRFHVLSEHELCEEEASITEMEGFNSHLNIEQMNKSIITLNDFYAKALARGRPAPYEAEFRAYHLLSLMGQHGKFKGDQQAFLSMLQGMRPEVRGSPAIQWVLKLQRALASSNFVGFFSLVRQAPYLLACLSHVYFGQVRGRALRTLAETQAVKADTPVPLELQWLVNTLMLDDIEDAQRLCHMHGFRTALQEDGTPVVLLVKGGYVNPPPPVPRKRSKLITGMAPATRSLAVTTPALPPMSAEEAAALEQQRQEQQRRLQAEAAARAEAAAAARSQQQAAAAAAAAAAEKQRREEEAARLAEEQRQREAELARQREAQLAVQQRQAAELAQRQQEEQRRQEEEARRQQQLAAARREEEERQRAAAEAERRQREAQEAERRRRLAEEAAERRRQAELERQRLEEQRRLEEERRRRREAKRRLAVQTLYLARWRQETRRRIEEREWQQRLAANLKACRVASKAARAEAAMASELQELQLDGAEPEAGSGAQQAAAAARAAIDLPSLAAPLLLQRSPAARTLYWKLLLAPVPAACAAGNGQASERLRLQQLQSWLALQLHCGRPVAAASGSACAEGPLALQFPSNGGGGAPAAAELTVCVASPASGSSGASSTAMAGASGIVLAVAGAPGSDAVQHLQQWLQPPSCAALQLPLLLVAASDAIAQQWQQAVTASSAAVPGPVHVMSVQGDAASAPQAASAANVQQRGPPAAFSKQRMVQGLRWLATHAPQQPVLKIVPVETLARDALAATSAPLQHSPAAATGGLPAAQLLSSALQQALQLVNQAAERACHHSAAAAWRWPPPEVAPPLLRTWHDGSALPALQSTLQRVRPDAAGLLRMAEGSSMQALRLAAQLQLAALEVSGLPPLVLPPEVEQWVEAQLAAAQAAAPPELPHALLAAARRQQQQQQRPGSPSLRQKRKWQAGSPPAATPSAAGAAALGRSWAAVVSGSSAGSARAVPAAPEAPQQQPPLSKLPLWESLRQRLLAEQQQEQGLQDHAVLAASGAGLPDNGDGLAAAAGLGGDDNWAPAAAPPGSKVSLLEQLQQQTAVERAASQRLMRLALM